MNYQTTDEIPLSTIIRDNQGDLDTGLTVHVTVHDVVDGAILANQVLCTEVATGLYTYNWVHGIVSRTFCVATFEKISNPTEFYREVVFTVDTIDNKVDAFQSDVDNRDGAAV